MTFAAIGERADYSRTMVTAPFRSKQGLIEAMLAIVPLGDAPSTPTEPALDLRDASLCVQLMAKDA